MKIAVASGKGGTGKTTVAVNLALSLAENGHTIQLLDCDVEEPNASLFLNIVPTRIRGVYLKNPVFDKERCTYCGKCAEFCQYNAIAVLPERVLLFAELCHGCGGCSLVCPEKAITEKEREIGKIEKAETKGIEFIQGVLNVGEAMATPVIRELKKETKEGRTTILDSPPGNACPVIETVRETDFCILVTEPTPFGLSDLKITVEVLRSLQVPFGVVVNRDGVGDDRIEKFCQREKIPLLLKIPESKELAHAYSRGVPFVEVLPVFKEKFVKLYKDIQEQEGTKERRK